MVTISAILVSLQFHQSAAVPDAGLDTAALDGDVGSVAIEELLPDLPRHLLRRRADLDELGAGAHRSGKLPITAHFMG